VSGRDLEIILAVGQFVHGHGHDVVGDRVAGILVQVVADPGPVREQVFDRHGVVDERQITAKYRPRRRGEVDRAALDQADDGERGDSFPAAGDPKPGVHCVGYPVRAVGQAVRLGEEHLTTMVNGDDTGEAIRIGKRVDHVCQRHPRTLP